MSYIDLTEYLKYEFLQQEFQLWNYFRYDTYYPSNAQFLLLIIILY